MKNKKPFMVREVRWFKPNTGWTKGNIDRATLGHRGFSKGCFTMPLSMRSTIFYEIRAFIVTIELAECKGWFPLWIETDLKDLVCKVFSNATNIP